jgi:hypothetical protein
MPVTMWRKKASVLIRTGPVRTGPVLAGRRVVDKVVNFPAWGKAHALALHGQNGKMGSDPITDL